MTKLNLLPYPQEVKKMEGFCSTEAVPRKIITSEYGEEGYLLTISAANIEIKGTKKGLFYAEQTLKQLQMQFGKQLPCLVIIDKPRFSYRGFMLDSSRHFLPAEDVLKLIDAAAYFKLNKLHWHLVDDQGWRIQIDTYPNLTEVGARRKKAHFGNIEEPEMSEGFFTKKEIRGIVAYAKERMIDIIPELEIPGHESALLAAYPEVGCGGEKVDVKTRGGIFDNLICAGRKENRKFITDILDEVIELFPGEYVHIGGDEACKRKWRSCSECQRRIKELGLKDENALQQSFVTDIKGYLGKHCKKTIVWNDSLRGGVLDSDFIVQAWMGDKELLTDFIERGGKLIQSDSRCYYLDYPYFMSDAKKILEFHPYPDYLDEKYNKAVLGIESPLWTERVPDLNTAAYLLFPRLPAMAECAWTVETARCNESFFERYEGVSEYLDGQGLIGAPRDHWNISGEAAVKDKQQYEFIQNTPENQKAWEIDGRLMAEERRIYGSEL